MPSEGLHSLAGICRFPLLSTLPFQAMQLRLGLRLQVTADRFELSLRLVLGSVDISREPYKSGDKAEKSKITDR